jgi:hypothetical protein
VPGMWTPCSEEPMRELMTAPGRWHWTTSVLFHNF